MAHQRRSDTWVKWGLFIQENGKYKINQGYQIADEDIRKIIQMKQNQLQEKMKHHLQELKREYDSKSKKQPYLFTVLKPKSIKTDKHRFLLLDRMLCSNALINQENDFEISKKLRERVSLWKSRGIEINGRFEKNARRWLAESINLQKIQEKQKLPLFVVRDSALKNYSGKVISMGSCDHKQHTYLVLKTDQSLLALMMRKEELLHYQLNQTVSIPYRYRNFVNNEIQKQKKISLDTFSKG